MTTKHLNRMQGRALAGITVVALDLARVLDVDARDLWHRGRGVPAGPRALEVLKA